MKVILTAYGTSGYSGLPKYFYFLAKHLAMNGIEVELIVDSLDREFKFYEVFADNVGIQKPKVTIIRPEFTGMLSKARYAYNIAQYLKDKDFDILHTCDVLPYFYLKQKNRKPVVFQPFSNEMF